MEAIDWHAMWALQKSPAEIVFRSAIIYVFAQVLLRLLGRKELSHHSTYAFVLIFLLSVAAREAIVGSDTSLTAAMLALVTLAALNWSASYLSFRSARIADFLSGRVRRLVENGIVQDKAMRQARISREDLIAYLRHHGTDTLTRVRDAYQERSGKVTFVFWETGAGP